MKTDLKLVRIDYGTKTNEALPNGPICPHCKARFSFKMKDGIRTCLDCYSEF
jgi:ribosomal protein L37AE/L43A